MNENDLTTINIKQNTKDRFFALGRYGESQDEILKRILDIVEPILKRKKQ